MKIDGNSLQMIQNLVGEISESNLKYVDCYISDELGIFIPSVGFCGTPCKFGYCLAG